MNPESSKTIKKYYWSKFIIESRQFWMERISNEQVIALIYSCLRRIDDNNLVELNVKGWKEISRRLQSFRLKKLNGGKDCRI